MAAYHEEDHHRREAASPRKRGFSSTCNHYHPPHRTTLSTIQPQSGIRQDISWWFIWECDVRCQCYKFHSISSSSGQWNIPISISIYPFSTFTLHTHSIKLHHCYGDHNQVKCRGKETDHRLYHDYLFIIWKFDGLTCLTHGSFLIWNDMN